MHAYLIVGNNTASKIQKVQELAKGLGAKIWEFPLIKISDTRELKSLTSLKVDCPTAIYIDNIDQATEETLNAFLKNLEEPQDNLYYILTANSLATVLPTITSRCQIIKTIYNLQFTINNENTSKFLKMSVGEKLAYCDQVKSREEAKTLTGKIIWELHFNLMNSAGDIGKIAKNLEIASLTLNNLKANGNVSLQLTNLAISFV